MRPKLKYPLLLQYILGRLAVFFVGPLVYCTIRLAGWRIRGLDGIRRQVADIMRRHEGPWLICGNHLTLVDSFIMAYAMFPLQRYLLRYRLVPWNVPEYMNFSRNPASGFLCYLLKCVPVKRGGDREDVKLTLAKCAHLLKTGENLMIFPEGTRSRFGRVNTGEFTYNVGQMFMNTPRCRVLLIYLRGDGQETYSNFPARGEVFSVRVAEAAPETPYRGFRAYRDCATQIVRQLAEMEDDYFASRGK
jgi:hypothetical protein